MALLASCSGISKSFGSRLLFENISLGISDGERLGNAQRNVGMSSAEHSYYVIVAVDGFVSELFRDFQELRVAAAVREHFAGHFRWRTARKCPAKCGHE